LVFGFLRTSSFGSRVTNWLRHFASATATVAGVLLLLADTADDGGNDDEDASVGCQYADFTGEFDYSSACPLEGSGGSLNVGTPTGHVFLAIPSTSATNSAGSAAIVSFNAAGLNVFDAYVGYTPCSAGQPAVVESVTLAVGRRGLSEFSCNRLALPVSSEQTLTCTQTIDAGPQPAMCTITFSPTPR
jgi:hypothetical protein